MPKVSVIIPNYNHARYLDQRMRSVLDQTYRDFEVIFLDDASTDNSRDVFGKYQGDSRIRAVFNEINSGSPFVQWNTGVRMAKGEYVWIAESDDYADTRLLETLVGVLDRNPDVGIAYCLSGIVDAAGNIVGNWKPWRVDPARWEGDYINSGLDEAARFLLHENTIPNASAVVFRKSLYEQAGYADETLRIAGDLKIWLRMLERSNIAFVARPLNSFRRHGATVRKKTLVEGTAFLEEYRLLAYLLDTFAPESADALKARDRLLADWTEFLLSRKGRSMLSRNMEIWRAASAVEPWLAFRLAVFCARRTWGHFCR